MVSGFEKVAATRFDETYFPALPLSYRAVESGPGRIRTGDLVVRSDVVPSAFAAIREGGHSCPPVYIVDWLSSREFRDKGLKRHSWLYH